MINYDKESWLRTTLVFHGTSWQAMYPRMLGFTALVLGVAAVNTWVVAMPALQPLAHTLIGLALGMLLVFRTNASYDRYWEGRKSWGSIVNASRNLVRAARAWSGPSNDISNHVVASAVALKNHLRASRDVSELSTWLTDADIAAVKDTPNIPLTITCRMTDLIQARLEDGRINAHIAQTLESYVSVIIDQQGVCERIRNTPMPFAYVVAVRQLLAVYLVTLPFVLIGELQAWAIPAAIIITFALLTIEEVGVQIEDPFGTDPNDLPLEDICAVIARDVKE